MLRVRNTSEVPPGGWSYTDPNTGARFKRTTWFQIMRVIGDHRRANNLSPLADDQIQHILCGEAHGSVCAEDGAPAPPAPPEAPAPGPVPGPVRLQAKDLIAGTKVLISFMASGRKTVPREEAEARARICVSCHLNLAYEKPCAGKCAQIEKAVRAVIGSTNRTKLDEHLHACGVCHCMNRAQIWLRLEDLRKGITPDMEFPDFCWKKPHAAQDS